MGLKEFNLKSIKFVQIILIDFKNINDIIMAIEVNDANFEEVVLQSDVPVVVDFWAEWCGPCRMVGPIVEDLSEEYKGRIVVAKMDVDSNPAVTSKLGIRNIPTILFFKGGQQVDKQVGAVPKTVLSQKIDALL